MAAVQENRRGSQGQQNAAHTVKNCMVRRKESVLEALGVVSRLEVFLVHYDVVDVLASKQSHLVAAMSIKDTKKGELFGVGLGLVGRGDQVEDGCVCILHADAPSLHGRDAIDESFIFALVGRLREHERVSIIDSRERERAVETGELETANGSLGR